MIRSKKLLHSPLEHVRWGQSNTNCHAYTVSVHRKKMIIAWNVWSAELQQMPSVAFPFVPPQFRARSGEQVCLVRLLDRPATGCTPGGAVRPHIRCRGFGLKGDRVWGRSVGDGRPWRLPLRSRSPPHSGPPWSGAELLWGALPSGLCVFWGSLGGAAGRFAYGTCEPPPRVPAPPTARPHRLLQGGRFGRGASV